MSLLVTTQSYRNDIATEYGLLLEMDENTGKILRTKRIDTPVQTERYNERIKPGLRGLYLYNDELYTASWNTIFVLDSRTFEVRRSFTHKWMSDLHGIFVDDDGVWVTSSYPDAMILYDFQGNPRAAMWAPETFLYKERATVDKDMDWSQRGKEFRGFHDYHCNNVEVHNGYIYVTGRSNLNGRIARISRDTFIQKGTATDEDITLFVKGLYGPHDGTWVDGSVYLTETMGSTVVKIKPNGKIDFRIKVKVSGDEVDPRKLDTLKMLRKRIGNFIKGRPTLDKTTHWTRGLAITQGFYYVGQSTWAGDQVSRARVVKINRKTRAITDAFYIDVPDYPETRIYQVLDLESARRRDNARAKTLVG
ncbi:MAG: hypothetical protein NW241_18960 [Bacteroidia bacterium]|nr:hypothetical protein [Bacteroidia bacterium]